MPVSVNLGVSWEIRENHLSVRAREDASSVTSSRDGSLSFDCVFKTGNSKACLEDGPSLREEDCNSCL